MFSELLESANNTCKFTLVLVLGVLWSGLLVTPGAARDLWIGTAPWCEAKPHHCMQIHGMRHVKTDRCGNGKCCWGSGRKQLCRTHPQDVKGSIWLGTAPICKATPADCGHFLKPMVASGLQSQCAGGSCCGPFGNPKKIHCKPVAGPPRAWFGTAPACGARESDCERHGMEFITTSKTGEGKLCFGAGIKVLCKMRERGPEAATQPGQFALVGLNVFARPYLITHDGQRERTCQIPAALARWEREIGTQFDALAISEAFIDGCEGQITFKDALAYHGWKYTTGKPGGQPGGVFIASRWPIASSDSWTFRAKVALSADSLVPKGVHYARIKKDDGNGRATFVNVFATHFQAWSGPAADKGMAARAGQAQEMAKFIRDQNIKPSEAVLMAGDFNVSKDGPEYRTVVDTLNAVLPPLDPESPEKRRTHVKTLADWSNPEGSSWLDFVFASGDHKQAKSARLLIKAMQPTQPFAACTSTGPLIRHSVSPESGDCLSSETFNALSDHAAVAGIFRY